MGWGGIPAGVGMMLPEDDGDGRVRRDDSLAGKVDLY